MPLCPRPPGPQSGMGQHTRHTGRPVVPCPLPQVFWKPHPHSLSFYPRDPWEDPNARYWAQFRGVRPQGSEERRRQQKLNKRVMGYCVLVMLAGMTLHYVAFRCSPRGLGIGRCREGQSKASWSQSFVPTTSGVSRPLIFLLVFGSTHSVQGLLLMVLRGALEISGVELGSATCK